jgi:YD repeat-containing protein
LHFPLQLRKLNLAVKRIKVLPKKFTTKSMGGLILCSFGLISKVLSVDLAGRPTSIQDENGVNTSLAYDARDRLATITVNPGAAQAVTTLTYDAAGNVTQLLLADSAQVNR